MHSRGQVRGQCCIVPNSRLKVNQNKKCFKIKSVIFSLFADALRTCSEFEGGTSFPAERGAKRNLVVARPPTRLARQAWSPLCYKSIEFGWCPSWRHRTVGFRRVSSCFGLYTGSRGDMFVVRTSKPVENLWKSGLFWSRYSFVTHSIDRKPRDWGLARSAYSIKYVLSFTRHFVPRSPFGRRAVRQRGYGLRLLIFKIANNKVDLGQIRSEEIVNCRFIKIPLG